MGDDLTKIQSEMTTADRGLLKLSMLWVDSGSIDQDEADAIIDLMRFNRDGAISQVEDKRREKAFWGLILSNIVLVLGGIVWLVQFFTRDT